MSIPYRVSSNFLFPIYAGTLFGGTLCAKSKDHDYGGLQRFYSSLATSIDRQWPEGEVVPTMEVFAILVIMISEAEVILE